MSDTHELERVTFEDMIREGVKLSDINYALAHRRGSIVLSASSTALFIIKIDEPRRDIYQQRICEILGFSCCIWKCSLP